MNYNGVTTVSVFVLACNVPCLAQHDEWDLAWRTREVVGLSPMDLAALDVAPEAQRELAAAYRDVYDSPETDTRALAALADARRAVGQDASWGRDSRVAFDRVRTCRSALIQEVRPVAESLLAASTHDGELLLPYVQRAVANAGIDSPYRLLHLTEEQRTQILARQEARDRFLRDARQWHRVAYMESVKGRFVEDVRTLLTESQLAELAAFEANIEANLAAVWAVELEGFPVELEGSADKRDISRMAKQLLADARQLLKDMGVAADQIARWLAAQLPPPAIADARQVDVGIGG